jgi:hypothetical protein
MWDLSITISSFEGADAAAPKSTRHLEISLAAIRPSCSKEDKDSSSRLQGSQLPPKVSVIADSVFDDFVEFSAASDVAAQWDDSGSMAARGVGEIMSRISREEEDKASLWRKKGKVASGEEFWAVARRRSWSSRGGAEERECMGENEV